MTKKKPEPNPIEKAIGDRAKPKTPKNPSQIPQNPSEIPDEPSHQEMLSLEELNRQTEERLRDDQESFQINQGIPEPMTTIVTPKSPIPVSKPVSQTATETSTQESPPQKIEKAKELPPLNKENELLAKQEERMERELNLPAEDVELTALKKYILEDGFVLSTVAFHIVSLCAEPLTTPSTTTWDFVDRAKIPDMVLALLKQPGYLEGIWPSLKIVMGSNKGNSAWTAGIATTIAFFDTIRVLPTIVELKGEQK